ncbi:hypothetical protein ACA910_007756 [Epithemia clementina (nom. ined.)]
MTASFKTQMTSYNFEDVMKKEDPRQFLAKNAVYYPEGTSAKQHDLFVFILGLGQVAKESSRRSRQYAERLQVGVVNLNNASFLKDNSIYKYVNPYLDWVDAGLDCMGVLGSPVIDHASILIYQAVMKQTKLNLAGDSHGTIFMSRALRCARNKFLGKSGSNHNLWEEQACANLNIVTFGNGHRCWPKGPKYVMNYIEGDPLPKSIGMTREQTRNRSDIKFLVFGPLPKLKSEAHNMMFTIEFLQAMFEKNDLEIGAMSNLLAKIQTDKCKVVNVKDVVWPNDLATYVFRNSSIDSLLTAAGILQSASF